MNPKIPCAPGSRPVNTVIHAVPDTEGSEERIGTNEPSSNSAARFGRRPAEASAFR